MTKYLTETHAHTSEVSLCGGVDAKTLVDTYKDAGYSTVVITDHFSHFTFPDISSLSAHEILDHYLKGYRTARDYAKGSLHILLGMELTFYENCNDYLIYGVTEQFLSEHTDIMGMGIKAFSLLAIENGLLVFQAHPFRNGMTVTNPCFLNGVEAYNGNPRHDSRNEIAAAWAKKFGLLTTAGSDFHQLCDVGHGGIITGKPITDTESLLRTLQKQPPLYKGKEQQQAK